MKAMILAAGLGIRLRPLTENIPKALVQVNGIPMIELVIRRLIYFGFDRIIVNLHHFPGKIMHFLNSKECFGIEITTSDERGKLLGTGGGIKKAAWFFNDDKPFLVHNVDVFSNINLLKFYQTHCQSDSLATLAVKKRKTSRHLIFDDKNYLCGWKNEQKGKKILSREPSSMYRELAFSGMHVVDPEIFKYMKDKDEFSIIDAYIEISKYRDIKAYRHDKTFWLDLGTPEGLDMAMKYKA